MTLQNLVVTIAVVVKKNNLSNGMAVPKKRRSKSKGKKRLSNWKRKGNEVRIKAWNAAKTFFARKKKEEASIIKKDEKIVDSSGSITETNN